MHERIDCRRCVETCDQRAIKVELKVDFTFAVDVQTERCNGCGACRATCPTGAIAIGET